MAVDKQAQVIKIHQEELILRQIVVLSNKEAMEVLLLDLVQITDQAVILQDMHILMAELNPIQVRVEAVPVHLVIIQLLLLPTCLVAVEVQEEEAAAEAVVVDILLLPEVVEVDIPVGVVTDKKSI